MSDLVTRVKNCFAREKIDINDKEKIVSFLTEYTINSGFPYTTRNFGHAAAVMTQSLYPDDLVVVGNGITSLKGKEYLDNLEKEREKLLSRNSNKNMLHVSISVDLRRTLWNIRKTVCEKYHMSLPMNVCLQEMIREWGVANDRED